MNELYDYSVQVTLHMPKKLKEAMNERAHDKRMSNSEYIRSLIVRDMGEDEVTVWMPIPEPKGA